MQAPQQRPEPYCLSLGHHAPGGNAFGGFRFWQLHLYPYAATAVIGGHQLAIQPGMAGLTPPWSPMQFHMPAAGNHLFAHFLQPGPALVERPCVIPLGAEFRRAEQALGECIPWLGTDPLRAGVRLWDVLCLVAAAVAAPDRELVGRARARIEAGLGGLLTVAILARDLGCSREHLVRTFRRQVGTTVVGYLRQRRVARAEHLLLTTPRAIGDIAREVGIPDPHAFNKLVRRELGRSPRACRRGEGQAGS